MAQVELEIPSESVYVGVVRLVLASIARTAGLDEERLDDLKIAVSEACANAVLSNQQGSPESPVTIVWTDTPERLTIEVSDRGGSFAPDPDDSLAGDDRLDLSVALLRSLVDQCEFDARAEGGTVTRLILTR